MSTRNRPTWRIFALQGLGLMVAALVLAFGISLRMGRAHAEPAEPAVPESGPETPSMAPIQDPSELTPPEADATARPIDLAVAPEGGVPFHPSGTPYRSPFAKPHAGHTVRVKVGTLLNSVDEYDVRTGTFTADFFLSFTSETPMPTLDLQFANGSVDTTKTLSDRPTFKLYRLTGSFKSPANLREYPYDAQELTIIVEDDLSGSDQMRFVADPERTQLGRGFRAVGWQVNYVEARSLSHSYPDRFEGDDLYYSRYIFTLGIERFGASAAFKVFVPAFVIVLISLFGMWVPPDQLDVRANSGAPMLAGAVLFHFALMQELPATSYLTRADKLMLGVYAALLLGMASTWAMLLVPERQQYMIFRVARVVVPVASLVAMVLAIRL